MVLSVASPAFTINKILLGFSKDCTNSSTVYVGTNFLSGCSATTSSVFDDERLKIETLYPRLSIFNAKLRPITAIPTTPICCFVMNLPPICFIFHSYVNKNR